MFSRIVLLSLAAALFVGLTGIYGGSVQSSLPNAHWQAERGHRQSGPEVWKVDEFVGAGGLVALWALMGRIILRLRLSPAPRGKGQPILLGLQRGRQNYQIIGDPEVGPRDSAIDPAHSPGI